MLKLSFLKRFLLRVFFGKSIEVSLYNKSIMNEPTFKTVIPDNNVKSFYDWAQQLSVSSSVPKDKGLDFNI